MSAHHRIGEIGTRSFGTYSSTGGLSDWQRRAERPPCLTATTAGHHTLELSEGSARGGLLIKGWVSFKSAKWASFQPALTGKYALKWTRLSCMRFAANAVRLQLHALAYNLANFLRTLATPEAIERWSLTSLRERLIKTGARLVRHGRYAIFQIAEAALPRQEFASILALINGLRGPPFTAVPA